jgi:hypothetical protein
MPLEALGLKEHIFNILVEASYETIGDLMLALKLDENKVLGLAGVGPKAIQNMHEQIAAMEFPELPVEAPPESVAPEQPAPAEAQVVETAQLPVAQAEVAEEAAEKAPPARVRDEAEEVEAENAKDGVSLDELFQMKPEIFRSTTAEEEEAEKKKGKKKKKGVELVLDEDLGEVVGLKKHKRGAGDELGIDE